MFHYLRGSYIDSAEDSLVIENNGIGFKIFVSAFTRQKAMEAKGELLLYIYTVIRDDALSYYGFLSEQEKMLFEALISVTGIGPKAAISLLSHLTCDEIVGAIAGGNEEAFTRIKGIGKKSAQRIIMELKDKVKALPNINTVGNEITQNLAEAREALLGLGYSQREVGEALAATLKKGLEDTGDIIREALKYLSQKGLKR